MVFWLLPLLLVSIASCGPHTLEERTQIAELCGRVPEAPQAIRSVGGRPAKPEEAPWAVALRNHGGHWCTGSLISDRFVLTAAHCFFIRCPQGLRAIQDSVKRKLDTSDVAVNAEFSKAPGNNSQIRKISRIYMQSHYCLNNVSTAAAESDLVLLELESPVKLSNLTAPVCLSNKETSFGTPLEYFGYGDNPEDNHKLYKYETKSAECTNELPFFFGRRDVSCASFPGRLACGGDSGGGYIEIVNNRKYIISTLTGGADCLPSIVAENQIHVDYNTYLFKHLPWICRYSGLCDEYSRIQQNEDIFDRDTLIFERTVQRNVFG